MKCKYFDCGWCYAPIDVVTSASSCGSCNYPEHCPYLKTEMTEKMDTVESIEAQIKMLQSKLEFYKELKNTKSPVEEAYKDWYGAYPTDGIAVDNSWDAFQAGYNAAQKDYKVGEHQEPVKQKDTLYKRFENEGAYGQIYYDDALKVTRKFLMDESVIEYEDEEYITFKLQKSLLEIPND